MKKHTLLLLLAWPPCMTAAAQTAQPSALNAREFEKYWRVESESADYKVSFRGDTLELLAPKGLTLWRRAKMGGTVSIEYDAQVVVEGDGDRLSDLNCFWMASDPQCPDDVMERAAWRQGVFERCYSLQTYYVGYGGNHNSTTRFRRYTGRDDEDHRPAVLAEYTDAAHLLQANRWYHVRLTNEGGRVRYYINGERLVDYLDPQPLKEGWFGFRTTLSRTRLTNFRYTETTTAETAAPLRWIGETPAEATSVTLGVPFDAGTVKTGDALALTTADGETLPTDTWPLAYWPDGSVKWMAASAVVPGGSDRLILQPGKPKKKTDGITIKQGERQMVVNTGAVTAYIPTQGGECLLDSLVTGGKRVGGAARLVASTQNHPGGSDAAELRFTDYRSLVEKVEVERQGTVSAVVKISGWHSGADGRKWLPFVVRLNFWAGSAEVKMQHTFTFDGDQDHDFIRSLGVRLGVPMRLEPYNRHVAFATDGGGVWSEPVQPLIGRRKLALEGRPRNDSLQTEQMAGHRLPAPEAFDSLGQQLVKHWAQWDGFRLSQTSSEGFTIRKRTQEGCPWMGTFDGRRAGGYAFVGDVEGGLGIQMDDFWQSYPSGIEIDKARSEEAELTLWLWSPDAEAMDLRHYDTVAHDLNASYEDVQPGMSSPYGICRTSTLTLLPGNGYEGKEAFARQAARLQLTRQLCATPEWLHGRRAFGVWSLPDSSTDERRRTESLLTQYVDFYREAIDQHRWYGFWNYGDVMHDYDPVRHSWRYDVGGYAWDNTELSSNLWLWYSFLRTGRADVWRMASAMTRHNSEVDVYHLGDYAGLGSRHNVSHWGCGAKEARISQAMWNRFLYYLTADERLGDVMEEVRDADQKLYTLDPMRLAQPREEYPCTAPARLRIGPDWLAYAGNWMTHWERTQDTAYLHKIEAGMRSIVALPHGIFTGPLALGYDPATGVLSTECDTSLLSTNHLMTIMGGFELMNEMEPMVSVDGWHEVWLDHALHYDEMARRVLHNSFRVLRLKSYAAWQLRDPELTRVAWRELWQRQVVSAQQTGINHLEPPLVPRPTDEWPTLNTNDAAMWSLDAIFMLEVN